MPNNITIISSKNPYARNFYHADPIVRVLPAEYPITANITDVKNFVQSIVPVSYANTTIEYSSMSMNAISVLPFRVSFETVGLRPYGPGNVPPIGIAVVGFNNYIL